MNEEDEETSDIRPLLPSKRGRQCCGNCAFFEATGNKGPAGPVDGLCVRYPPDHEGWPDTEERFWCGEWKWWDRDGTTH